LRITCRVLLSIKDPYGNPFLLNLIIDGVGVGGRAKEKKKDY
jgi:hypothetical protein